MGLPLTLLTVLAFTTASHVFANPANVTSDAVTSENLTADSQNVNSGLPPGLEALRFKKSAEVAHYRQVFYLGGEYVTNSTTKFTAYNNQTYVEQLLPTGGVKRANPLVFFHGGGYTGATWLQTPDNRRGWASYFLNKGYAVYLVDIAGTARSSRHPTQAALDAAPVEIVEKYFSASQKFPDSYPQAKLHTQWPSGTGLQGDPTFDQFYLATAQMNIDFAGTQVAVQAAICQLLSYIGKSFLIGHSLGGLYLWMVGDKCPDLVQGIFGIEPDTTPFQNLDSGVSFPTRPWGLTDAPITYDPPVTDVQAQLTSQTVKVGTDSPGNHSCFLQKEPARKLPNLAKIPTYFYTTESSIHVTYDHCLSAFLTQAGVSHTWQLLTDLGITGNGHFSFLEKNNLQLAALAEKFFQKHARKGRRRTA